MPSKLLQYLPLYARVLTEIGTKKSNFSDLSLNIGAYTGGLRASVFLQESLLNDEGIKMLALTARSTKKNITKLCNLLNEIAFSAEFDNKERFMQILLEEKARVERMLIPSGRNFATTRLGARFTKIGVLCENNQGVNYVQFVRELAKNCESNWQDILENFQVIHKHMFDKKNVILDITGDGDTLALAKPELASFINSLNASNLEPNQAWDYNYLDKFVNKIKLFLD